jgi:hypothetical protein
MVAQKNSLPFGLYRKFLGEPRSVRFVSMAFEDQDMLLRHKIIIFIHRWLFILAKPMGKLCKPNCKFLTNHLAAYGWGWARVPEGTSGLKGHFKFLIQI